ncbi:hypothetical protein PENTCL1PPCAC_15575, partial [Pristionchus entomophagus]
MAYIHILYIPLLCLGILFNIILIIAIARGTPKALKVEIQILCHLIVIMTSGLVESVLIQSISFGYRDYILTHPSPKALAVHAVVLLNTIPNIIHLILFKHVKVADVGLFETLADAYPHANWTGATFYGIPRLGECYPAALFGAFFVVIPALFLYLI